VTKSRCPEVDLLPPIIPELVCDRPLPVPDRSLPVPDRPVHRQVAHQRPKSPRKAISPGFFAPEEPPPRRPKPPLADIVRSMPDRMCVTDLAMFVNRECGLAGHERPTPHTTYSSGEIRDEMRAQGFVTLSRGQLSSHRPALYYVRSGSEAERKLREQQVQEEPTCPSPGLPPPDAPLKGQILRHQRKISATSPPSILPLSETQP
jgi:hypothetical protein